MKTVAEQQADFNREFNECSLSGETSEWGMSIEVNVLRKVNKKTTRHII